MTSKPTDISRRPATEADRETFLKIHHRAYHNVVVAQFGSWDEDLQNSFVDKKWDSGSIQLITAQRQVIGFLILVNKPDHWFLSEIVIDPEHQERGVGSSIMIEVIRRARTNHLALRLRVLKKNRALSLYSRLGFQTFDESATHFMMEIK